MFRISKDDFEAWWSSPVGLVFKEVLSENLQKLAHGTMRIDYAKDPIMKAEEVGRYEAISEILAIDFNYLTGE